MREETHETVILSGWFKVMKHGHGYTYMIRFRHQDIKKKKIK